MRGETCVRECRHFGRQGGRWRAGAEKADALKFDIPFVVRAAPANPSEPQAKSLSGALKDKSALSNKRPTAHDTHAGSRYLHEATQRTLIACGGSISKDPASTLGGG